MIDQGIVLNISLQIKRLAQTDISNPLLKQILWLLEDFSAGSSEHSQVLMNSNIVTRVFKVIEILIDLLSKCVID
jgi:hypothetical protein